MSTNNSLDNKFKGKKLILFIAILYLLIAQGKSLSITLTSKVINSSTSFSLLESNPAPKGTITYIVTFPAGFDLSSVVTTGNQDCIGSFNLTVLSCSKDTAARTVTFNGQIPGAGIFIAEVRNVLNSSVIGSHTLSTNWNSGSQSSSQSQSFALEYRQLNQVTLSAGVSTTYTITDLTISIDTTLAIGSNSKTTIKFPNWFANQSTLFYITNISPTCTFSIDGSTPPTSAASRCEFSQVTRILTVQIPDNIQANLANNLIIKVENAFLTPPTTDQVTNFQVQVKNSADVIQQQKKSGITITMTQPAITLPVSLSSSPSTIGQDATYTFILQPLYYPLNFNVEIIFPSELGLGQTQQINARDVTLTRTIVTQRVQANKYLIKNIVDAPNQSLIVINIIQLANPQTTAQTSSFTLTILTPSGSKVL